MGIDCLPEPAGVFPTVYDKVNEVDRRPLVHDGERFVNYVSIENSEHGQQVLQELVEKGYVDKTAALDEARRALGGEPVLSKLAPHQHVQE